MARVAVALLAVLSLTAFAPAPLPRPARGRPADDLIGIAHFEGTWKLVGMVTVDQGGKRSEWKNWGIAAVRVKGGVWTYVNTGGSENANYSLVIPDTRGPAPIDWHTAGDTKQPASMRGIIRRVGNKVEILGLVGVTPEQQRQATFTDPPVGWWIMTLEEGNEMCRAALALLVLFALTAFAPAPLPRSARRERESGYIDMRRFQGDWAVLSMEIVRGNGQPNQKLPDWGENVTSGTSGVRVKGDVFTYLAPRNVGGSYRVDIDPSKHPAAIDWFTDLKKRDGEKPGMLGLIRRDRDRLVILYYATTPDRRPTTLENPPAGWWILTLRRK